MLRAVITAGGRVTGAFAAAIGTDVKALAPFGNALLIDRAIVALRSAGIADIAVVGGDVVAAHVAGPGVRVIAEAGDGAANVQLALDAWSDGELVFLTSDLPFVDGASLRALIDASAAFDLTMPLASGAAYDAAFPGAPPHVTTLGNERVANGSAFVMTAAGRAAVRAVAAPFFNARKSALAMARLLGPGLLLRYALRRLRIADIERGACRGLGVRAAAVRDASPLLCYDIDTLDDYRYACARP